MLAESDKNKYEMPETNVENLAYESKMINIVIGKVHQIYTDVTSDDIARYVRQILAEDEYHRMKPTEVAKEVVAMFFKYKKHNRYADKFEDTYPDAK